jgi:hypothetical protein
MKRLWLGAALAALLVLSACTFSSNHEVWPLGSGEEPPLDGHTGFSCYGTGKNGMPDGVNHYHLTARMQGAELWYSLSSDESNSADSTSSDKGTIPMTFHRVDPERDLYVVATGKGGDEPGERINFAWINPSYGLIFVVPDSAEVDALASQFGITLELDFGELVMTGQKQREFLTELAKSFTTAETFISCFPTP